MSSLPGNIDFAKSEEDICKKWAEEKTFQTQNRLSEERGDEVSIIFFDVLPCHVNLM
jgi:isoleucyl-tRNA synthetase